MHSLRVLPVVFVLLGSGVLWLFRPRVDDVIFPAQDENSLACQSNLRRIALSFAHYAQDFDGKFPRGVDPEDRAPQTWQNGYSGNFSDDARAAPLLHELLRPYLKDKTVWRCPSDTGWGAARGNFSSRLGAVAPSSFARFDTSYYYYTIHGFAGLRPADFPSPARDIVLFDGDFWHSSETGKTLNAMFADGHVETLSLQKFNAWGDEQTRVLQTIPAARSG